MYVVLYEADLYRFCERQNDKRCLKKRIFWEEISCLCWMFACLRRRLPRQRWEVQSIFATDPLQRSWMFACLRRARRSTLGPDVTRSSCSSGAATQIWTSGIICKSKKFSGGKEVIGQNHFHLHLIFKAKTWYHKGNHWIQQAGDAKMRSLITTLLLANLVIGGLKPPSVFVSVLVSVSSF